MTERVYFKDENGAIELPITDGTLYTDKIPSNYAKSCVVIAFYDANGDIVTPTSGTCSVEASPIDDQWFAGVSSGDSVIDVTKAGDEATYNIPVFESVVVQARITFAGVTGADHAIAFVWGV